MFGAPRLPDSPEHSPGYRFNPVGECSGVPMPDM